MVSISSNSGENMEGLRATVLNMQPNYGEHIVVCNQLTVAIIETISSLRCGVRLVYDIIDHTVLLAALLGNPGNRNHLFTL